MQGLSLRSPTRSPKTGSDSCTLERVPSFCSRQRVAEHTQTSGSRRKSLSRKGEPCANSKFPKPNQRNRGSTRIARSGCRRSALYRSWDQLQGPGEGSSLPQLRGSRAERTPCGARAQRGVPGTRSSASEALSLRLHFTTNRPSRVLRWVARPHPPTTTDRERDRSETERRPISGPAPESPTSAQPRRESRAPALSSRGAASRPYVGERDLPLALGRKNR
jgi:hypothetical protein